MRRFTHVGAGADRRFQRAFQAGIGADAFVIARLKVGAGLALSQHLLVQLRDVGCVAAARQRQVVLVVVGAVKVRHKHKLLAAGRVQRGPGRCCDLVDLGRQGGLFGRRSAA